MPKVHSKIPYMSKENVKINTKSPEAQKTDNTLPSEGSASKKRKLSKIINTNANTSVIIRPSKYARKSISQTSKIYNKSKPSPNNSFSKTTTSTTTPTTTPSSITKTTTTNTKIKSPSTTSENHSNSNSKIISPSLSKTSSTISKTSSVSRISSPTLTRPRSSLSTKTSVSKITKPEPKVKPLSTHKPIIKKTIPSKTSIKSKSPISHNTTPTNTAGKKIVKPPKSKYGITLTKRPKRSGWDTKVIYIYIIYKYIY